MRMPLALLILPATALAFAAFPMAANAAGQGAPRIGADGVSAVAQCVAEAAAYSEVADLATSYRAGGDIFADALYDLREQLLDCLATSEDEPEDGSLLSSGDSRLI